MHFVLFLSLTNVAEKRSREQRSGRILFLRTEASSQAITKLQRRGSRQSLRRACACPGTRVQGRATFGSYSVQLWIARRATSERPPHRRQPAAGRLQDPAAEGSNAAVDLASVKARVAFTPGHVGPGAATVWLSISR